MKRVLLIIFLLSFGQLASAELNVITYHDIVSDPGNNAFATSRAMFVAHLEYIEKHGYRVISLSELESLYRKRQPIPHKSIMLTFDDGLKSYYEYVVPLLKIYGYPSVSSVVTAWVDGVNTPKEYQNKIMSWDQLREISQSKLVDIISHTNNLHSSIRSNPQGNEAAAAVTRKYFTDTKDYESEKFFRQRIHLDLSRSIKRIKKELNKQPFAIAWPFGEFDAVVSQEAKLLGLALQFTLEGGPTSAEILPKVNRIMLVNSRRISDFENDLAYKFKYPNLVNVLRLHLEDFANKSADDVEELLSALLDSIQSADIGAVIINPFYAKKNATFFYNSQINVNNDIVNRITHQLKYRLGVKNIFMDVPQIKSKKLDRNKLYTDLARLNTFNGVLVGTNDYSKVKDAMGHMRRYRSGLKFGVRNIEKPDKGMRFAIFTENLTSSKSALNKIALRINNMSVETYLLIKLDVDKVNATAGMLRRMRELGVRRVGVSAGVKSFIKYNEKLLAIKAIKKAKTMLGFRSLQL